MFISKTNVLRGRSPVFIDGIGTDTPSNMTNPDFSINYTAGGVRLVMSFGAVSNLQYVAVCASNLGPNAQVTARNGTSSATYQSIRGQYFSKRDHVCMFNFERENFSDLIIVVDSNDAQYIPIVSYIAAGEAIKVPNGGETGGYTRNWLTRGLKSRVTGNSNAAPIANLTKSISLKGNLSLPNMTSEFARNEWQDFLDHASTSPFFICEQQDYIQFLGYDSYRAAGGIPEASYICFEPNFKAPKAHSDTRVLENISLGFNCYNGL